LKHTYSRIPLQEGANRTSETFFPSTVKHLSLRALRCALASSGSSNSLPDLRETRSAISSPSPSSLSTVP